MDKLHYMCHAEMDTVRLEYTVSTPWADFRKTSML